MVEMASRGCEGAPENQTYVTVTIALPKVGEIFLMQGPGDASMADIKNKCMNMHAPA